MVFVAGRLQIRKHTIHISFSKKSSCHRLLSLLLRAKTAFPNQVLSQFLDGRKAILGLRERHECCIPEVVAVKVWVQNQIRRVTRMCDHRPDGRNKMRVRLVGAFNGRTFQLPLEAVPLLT